MNKELFVETIEKLKLQKNIDNQFASHLGRAFPSAFEANLLPPNDTLRNQLIKILQIETGDYQDSNRSWIDYFVWELDYGKKYKSGMALDKNGDEIDLSDSGKLFDFLERDNRKSN